MLRMLWPLPVLALLASPVAAQEAEPPAAAPVLVTMGTAAITGVYFPVGVALCRLVNQHRRETGLRCAARPTDGSVANIAGLRDGSLRPRHRAVRRPGRRPAPAPAPSPPPGRSTACAR